jgi:hypothetical protein
MPDGGRMTGIFNEHLTLSADEEHMLHIVERPGGFRVEIFEGKFHAMACITTGMATELAGWINDHRSAEGKQ